MSYRSIFGVSLFSISILFGAPMEASIVTQPTELNTGDQYRLAFVTSSVTQAVNPNIAYYNAFVTTAANGSSDLADLSTTWRAIVSTADGTDARDNTGTNPDIDGSGVPIFILDGTRVANDNAGLWSGQLLSRLNVTEAGLVSTPTNVWTGTIADGTSWALWNVLGNTIVTGLGAPGGGFGYTDTDPLVNGVNWIANHDLALVRAYPVYGVSDVITVGGSNATPVVPEPVSVVVWGFLGTLGLMVRKGRTRQAA